MTDSKGVCTVVDPNRSTTLLMKKSRHDSIEEDIVLFIMLHTHTHTVTISEPHAHIQSCPCAPTISTPL